MDGGDLPQSLRARQAAALEMAEAWDIKPQPFTKAEAATLAQQLSASSRDAAGVVTQMRTLKDLRSAFSNDEVFYQAMEQVATGRPEVAVAGCILGARQPVKVNDKEIGQEVVAQRILDGLHRMESGKGPTQMPEDAKFAPYFWGEVGDALTPAMARVAFDAAKAYYAGAVPASAMAGPAAKVMDDTVFRAGVQAVTGGIVSVNGNKVVAPYGVDELNFEAGLRKQYEAAGNPGAAFGKYRFVLGEKPNTYEAVVAGTGTRLMNAATGQPMVFDFRDPQSYAQAVSGVGLWNVYKGRGGAIEPREAKLK